LKSYHKSICTLTNSGKENIDLTQGRYRFNEHDCRPAIARRS